MTSVLRTLISVALIALPFAPCAYGEIDEVERLFHGDVAPRDIKPHVAPETAEAKHALPGAFSVVPVPDATRYSTSTAWHGASDPQIAISADDADAVLDKDAAKQAAPAPLNPVPEPSAIVLALAALAYFLLFGRRRRVI